jgi:hypothetical protein
MQYRNGASVYISQAADFSPVPAFAAFRATAMTGWLIKDHMQERTEQG